MRVYLSFISFSHIIRCFERGETNRFTYTSFDLFIMLPWQSWFTAIHVHTIPNIIDDTYANHIFSFRHLHLNIQLYWILFTMYWSCISYENLWEKKRFLNAYFRFLCVFWFCVMILCQCWRMHGTYYIAYVKVCTLYAAWTTWIVEWTVNSCVSR